MKKFILVFVTMPPPAGDPGQTLKRLRESRGLTQQELADKLGKTRSAVAAWEYGRRMSQPSRAAVAKVFGVPADTFGKAWNPNDARPQHGKRQRAERAYMATLRDLVGLPEGDHPNTAVVDPHGVSGVTSSAQPNRKDLSDMLHVPDPDLLQRVVGYWCAMTSDARMSLLRKAYSLADPDSAAVDTARLGKA